MGNASNAAAQFFQLFVLAQLGTTKLVGQYGLGIALTTPLFLLTSLGLRNSQVIEGNQRYPFLDYATLRAFTSLATMLLLVGITRLTAMDLHTSMIIILFGLIRTGEGLSDVIFGVFQRAERLDLVGQSLIVKAILSVLSFSATFFFSGSLSLSLASVTFVWAIRFFIFDVRHLFDIQNVEFTSSQILTQMRKIPLAAFQERHRLAHLAIFSFPLGMSSALISFNANVPRYVLEWSTGTVALGVFTVLTYSVSAGNLIINSVSQAMLPRLSRLFREGRHRELSQIINRMMLLGGGVGATVLLMSLLLGQQFLRLVFGDIYATHFDSFVILAIGIGIDFFNWFMNAALLSLRESWFLLRLQLVVFCAIVLFSLLIIPSFGVNGAAWTVTGAIALQAISKYWAFSSKMSKITTCASNSQRQESV